MIGIFVCDPGNATGLAWGIVDESADTVSDAIAGIVAAGSDTLKGNTISQGIEICSRWSAFYHDCHYEYGIDTENVFMIVEDFILSPQAPPGKDIVEPVKIAWFIMGYRLGQGIEYDRGGWGPTGPISIVWQTAGQAKGYAKDARLKRWGLWVRGREHERDAWRHFAFFIYDRLD